MDAFAREKITVIMPVYKAEKYLARSVESVLAQTYTNLELILVDDGSPDGSGALCEDYAARDSRVRVIHRENGGAAAARNTGLDAAVGDYIAFVDADDHAAPEMLERLYAALTAGGADMSLCGVAYVDGEDRPLMDLPPMAAEVVGPKEFYERMEFAPERWRYIVPWNRLHRRALFDGVRFREGRIYEDEILATEQTMLCRSIAVIPDVLYYDVRREASVMTSPVSLKNLAAVEAFTERYDFYRAQGWPDLARSALRRAYINLWTVLDKVDVPAGREKIEPWVKAVAGRMLGRGDLRALWLRLHYRRLLAGR